MMRALRSTTDVPWCTVSSSFSSCRPSLLLENPSSEVEALMLRILELRSSERAEKFSLPMDSMTSPSSPQYLKNPSKSAKFFEYRELMSELERATPLRLPRSCSWVSVTFLWGGPFGSPECPFEMGKVTRVAFCVTHSPPRDSENAFVLSLIANSDFLSNLLLPTGDPLKSSHFCLYSKIESRFFELLRLTTLLSTSGVCVSSTLTEPCPFEDPLLLTEADPMLITGSSVERPDTCWLFTYWGLVAANLSTALTRPLFASLSRSICLLKNSGPFTKMRDASTSAEPCDFFSIMQSSIS